MDTVPENTEKQTEPISPNEETIPSDDNIKMFVSSYIFLNPLTTGKRHTNLFKLACEARRRLYPEENILRELEPYLEHTNFPASELKSVISSGYKQVNSSSDFSSTPNPGVSQKDKWTNSPYDHLEKDMDEEENYCQGEELRKSTPTFPDNLYQNMPDLFSECILEECTSRERDISFPILPR